MPRPRAEKIILRAHTRVGDKVFGGFARLQEHSLRSSRATEGSACFRCFEDATLLAKTLYIPFICPACRRRFYPFSLAVARALGVCVRSRHISALLVRAAVI